MKTWTGFLTGALVVGTSMLGMLPADADTIMHGRISFDAGSTMVKGVEDADWSYATVNTLILPHDTLWIDQGGTMELEMAGGSFLRMADSSKAEIASLPPSASIRGWTGAFYVQRTARSTGDFVFETPACVAQIEPDSQIRVDIVGAGATTVTVRWGRATVRVQGGPSSLVGAGDRIYVDPGCLPSACVPFDRSNEDSFDSWNRERAQALAGNAAPLTQTVVPVTTVIGASDLTPYGDWVSVGSTYYWRPTVVVDYVPYRDGHWSFVPGCGYVWVDNYPFGYVTSHYGRWTYDGYYGWVWSYRDVWSPAAVASLRCGSNFVWCPLDPWDQPVIVNGRYYTEGGIEFGLYASSYCPVGQLLVGPGVVYPCTQSVLSRVPPSEVNIWNININVNGSNWASRAETRHGSNGDYTVGGSPMEVRNYFPQRVIRGPSTLGGTSPRAASARIASLEKTEGRTRFEMATVRGSDVSRTSVNGAARSAQLRQVRVSPEYAKESVAGMSGRSRATISGRGLTGETSDESRSRRMVNTPGTTPPQATMRNEGTPSSRSSVRSGAPATSVDKRTEPSYRGESSSRIVTPMPATRSNTSSSGTTTSPTPSRRTAPRAEEGVSLPSSSPATRVPNNSEVRMSNPERSTRSVVTRPQGTSGRSEATVPSTRSYTPSAPSRSTSEQTIRTAPSTRSYTPSASSSRSVEKTIRTAPSIGRSVPRSSPEPVTSYQRSPSMSMPSRSMPSASESNRSFGGASSSSRRSR